MYGRVKFLGSFSDCNPSGQRIKTKKMEVCVFKECFGNLTDIWRKFRSKGARCVLFFNTY